MYIREDLINTKDISDIPPHLFKKPSKIMRNRIPLSKVTAWTTRKKTQSFQCNILCMISLLNFIAPATFDEVLVAYYRVFKKTPFIKPIHFMYNGIYKTLSALIHNNYICFKYDLVTLVPKK